METTKTFYQQITHQISQIDLQKIIQVLQHAISAQSTQTHKKVYDMLKQIQSHPDSYLIFVCIFLNPNFNQNLRYMAGVTMKSALPRNSKEIHFQENHKSLMKGALISQNISGSTKLKSLQNILISQLAICFQQVDWQLIYILISNINENPEVIALLTTIFEDLKHNSENHHYYEGAVQTQVIQNLLKTIHSFMLHLINQIDYIKYDNFHNQLKYLTQSFKLLKVLTFHLPLKLSEYLKTLINQIIMPLLKSLSIACSEVNNNIGILQSQHNFFIYKSFIIQFFQLINQISETKAMYLLENKQFHDYFILHFPLGLQQFRRKFLQVCKVWTNTVLQLLLNDQPNQNEDFQSENNLTNLKMSNYIEVITQRVIIGFKFTKQDQSHILQQMQLEHNPYTSQQSLTNQNQQEDDNQQNFQTKHGKAHGSTLRKISITCIQKISQQYENTFWANTKLFVYELLKNQSDYRLQQAGIILIGIVAQNSIEQIRPDSSQILQYLLLILSHLHHQIVMASTLWAFQKLIPCYKDNNQSKKKIYQVIYKVMGNREQYSNLKDSKNLMIKQAAVSLLDQLISQQIQMDLGILQTMLQCLYYALQHFTGRALFNVFKALSSIFEQSQKQSIQDLIVGQTIKHLCMKWSKSVSKDSIMCPLIQCLSYICQNRKKYFIQYALQIFSQIFPLFKQKDRKSLVLRVIDLATSIIVSAKQFENSQNFIKIRETVSSQEFLSTINYLLLSEQKQIRHFGYGLLSEIIKLGKVSDSQAQFFIQSIAKSMDRNNSTSVNNAMMCITDIIENHKKVGQIYTPQIMVVIYDFIQKFPTLQLSKIYLLNFCRMFGRMALINIDSSKSFILNSRTLIKQLSQGLRGQQKSQLTLTAFRGILCIIQSLTQIQLRKLIVQKQIQSIIDSFMAYKYNAENKDNMLLIGNIFKKIKLILQKQNVSWSQYLNSTNLYPAVVNRILQIVN